MRIFDFDQADILQYLSGKDTKFEAKESYNKFESPCVRRNLKSAAMPAARAPKHPDVTVDLPYTRSICEQNNKDEIFFFFNSISYALYSDTRANTQCNNNDFPKQ